MGVGEFLDPLGRGQKAEESQVVSAALLEVVDRRDGRVGGGQHRVDDDDQPVLEVGRGLEVILDRLQRLVVAVDADMGDAGGGDEIEHAIEQPVAGA